MRTTRRLGGRILDGRGRFLALGELRERSLHIEQRLRLHLDQRQLPGRRQSAHHLPHLGARGERREKRLGIVAAGGDHRLQIHRHQHRERRDLGHADARGHRLLVSGLQRLPQRFLASALIQGNDAHRGPELVQGAQHGGLGQLPAQLLLDFRRGQNAAAFQQLPDVGDEGGDAIGARGSRGVLPVAVAAQCVNEGQRLFADQEVGVVGRRAEQIQRQGRVGLDQPDQQVFRAVNRRARRRRVGLAQACLHKGRRGSGNLRLAGKK
jgi:hypothetical protein